MDLLDLYYSSMEHKPILEDIKDLFISGCGSNTYFKNDDISINETASGSSFFIAGVKVFDILKRRDGDVLNCKKSVLQLLSLLPYAVDCKDKNSADMVRILDTYAFLNAIHNSANQIFMHCLGLKDVFEFGCCSSFIQCSDAKHCISEDREMYFGCAYRKNLENGKIFYGKNKNV